MRNYNENAKLFVWREGMDSMGLLLNSWNFEVRLLELIEFLHETEIVLK